MDTISRPFSFTLISATGLPDVRNFGRMKVYAQVSLQSAKMKSHTFVDEVNDTNPVWNTTFNFLIPKSSSEEGPGHVVHMIDVILYCKRTLDDDKYIGRVNINLNELFQGSLSNTLTKPVWVEDHKSIQGTIKFSYNFGDLVTAKVEPSPVVVPGLPYEQSSLERFGKRIVEATIVTAIVEGGKEVIKAIMDS